MHESYLLLLAGGFFILAIILKIIQLIIGWFINNWEEPIKYKPTKQEEKDEYIKKCKRWEQALQLRN